jgi:hypothetical protein
MICICVLGRMRRSGCGATLQANGFASRLRSSRHVAEHALAAWLYERRYLRSCTHAAALAAGADDPTTLTATGFVTCLIERDYQAAAQIPLCLSRVHLSSAQVISVETKLDLAAQFLSRDRKLEHGDPTIPLLKLRSVTGHGQAIPLPMPNKVKPGGCFDRQAVPSVRDRQYPRGLPALV